MDLHIPHTGQKRIVVIGGGFGGLEAVKKLNRYDVQIVMLDKHNYHTFQPLLYQVATGALEPGSIAYPLRKFMQQISNAYFRMAKVKSIDSSEQIVHTEIGDIHYDYLIIATGSKTNFFSFPEAVSSKMMQMKDIPQALDLRSFILENFEEALLTENEIKKQELVNIAIVGGGPTGVELAGALGEMKTNILPKDYPELDFRKMQIHLFEATDRILNAMSAESSEKALEYIKKFGVNVWTSTSVNGYDGNQLSLSNGKTVRTDTVIWTAGVKGNPIEGLPKEAMTPNGRILVDAYNKVQGTEKVYAIGDVACMISEAFPRGHAMVAPVAMQQGQLVAENIWKDIKGKSNKPFAYFDKGSMATVGRNKAVVEVANIKFGGFMAWLTWLFVHMLTLIGFRNKLVVTIGWIYNYFSYDRTLRLIIRPFKRTE